MKKAKARLIAVDGVDAHAVIAAARRRLGSGTPGGISHWDASGVFHELKMAEGAGGAPSPRTLLLLYAADLAFRLRWEIRPALAEGATVLAAPYVDTAVAFGKAAGIQAGWLANLFRFAPRPAERVIVDIERDRLRKSVDGFIGFGCRELAGTPAGRKPKEVLVAAMEELKQAARRVRKHKSS